MGKRVTRKFEVRIVWPYGSSPGNDDVVEVEIEGEVPENPDDHPEIQEAINETIWGVLEAIVTEIK